jgi:hypothetical protein
MHMAGGGDAQGGRGDARASCASPLGTPLLDSTFKCRVSLYMPPPRPAPKTGVAKTLTIERNKGNFFQLNEKYTQQFAN